MHKLRSKCRNEAKKISTKLFFGGYHFFPSWNVLIKSNIQLEHSFLLSPKPIMHWTRAPYYFIHFVYIRSHGRFIKLDRKWFPVHFSLWFSAFPSVYIVQVHVNNYVSMCLWMCAVLAWCDGFFWTSFYHSWNSIDGNMIARNSHFLYTQFEAFMMSVKCFFVCAFK